MGTDNKRAFAFGGAMLLLMSVAVPTMAQDAEVDQLQRVLDKGLIVMSTDPLYPPQSFLDDDGEIVGFDLDVGAAIAERLGVQFVPTPTPWAVVASGRWAGRMDFSVGSMTITTPRKEMIDFTQVYRFDQGGLAVREGVEASSLADLEGLTVCVGESTTYYDWLNGSLELDESAGAAIYAEPPPNITIETRETDRNCANEWASGRTDTDAWATAQATIFEAVAEGLPVVPLGEPVFAEPLAVAFDNSVEDNDSLVAAVDGILTEMHEDGTLAELSEKWYGIDMTKAPTE